MCSVVFLGHPNGSGLLEQRPIFHTSRLFHFKLLGSLRWLSTCTINRFLPHCLQLLSRLFDLPSKVEECIHRRITRCAVKDPTPGILDNLLKAFPDGTCLSFKTNLPFSLFTNPH